MDGLSQQDSETPGDSGDTPRPPRTEFVPEKKREDRHLGFGRHLGKHGRRCSHHPGEED